MIGCFPSTMAKSCIIIFSLLACVVADVSLDRSTTTFNAIENKFASTPHDNPCASWWQSANMYEEIANYGLNPLVPASSVKNATDILNKMLKKALLSMPIFELSTSNDDVLWWCLAFEKSYILTNNVKFLELAEMTLQHVMRDWTDTCNGGLLWDHKKTYKNAITNELLLSASTKLFETTRDSKYLDIAIQTWNWFNASGMIDDTDGLIDDGLADSPDCSAVYQVICEDETCFDDCVCVCMCVCLFEKTLPLCEVIHLFCAWVHYIYIYIFSMLTKNKQ
jgi:hypothetical protein